MKFEVVWQEEVYDSFNRLKEVNDKRPFRIQAISVELARERAENKANKLLIIELKPTQNNELHIPKIIALIDECGTHHQLREK